MLIPVPPLQTQNKIVTFLDNEVAFIDSIIQRSEALTDRLVEFKGSLITSAVCGEIPVEQLENLYDEQWVNNILSDSKLASQIDLPKESHLTSWKINFSRGSNHDSRFEGYDAVKSKAPAEVALDYNREHSLYPWKRLRSLATESFRYGHHISGKPTGNVRIIKVGDVDLNRRVRFDNLPSYCDDPDTEHLLLRHGDILMARKGTVGKTFYFDSEYEEGKFTYNDNWIRVRVDSELIISKFLYYFTLTGNFWNWVISVNTVTTVPGISGLKYGELFVPVPDLPTQQRIIDFLDKKIPQIDNLIAKLIELKNLQSEYRLSLISHAVTGMIDVDEFSAEHASNWEARKRHLESQEEIVATQRQKRGKALRINSMEKEKSYGEVFPWWEIVVDILNNEKTKG